MLDRSAPLAAGGVTLFALCAYLLTLATDLVWSPYGIDSVELVAAAYTLGIPHPPGYPTYILLGYLFTHLPGITPWSGLTFFSALCTALTAGVLTHLLVRILNSQPDKRANNLPLALSGGLIFALFPIVWGQALIPEVYALNILVNSLLLHQVITAVLTDSLSRRQAVRIGFLCGLSLTTHLTSAIWFPALLTWLNRPLKGRYLLPLSLGGLLGLSPLLSLFLLPLANSPVQWGDSTTPGGWWWLVSATLYRPNLFAIQAPELSRRLADWLLAAGIQLVFIGWLPALLSLRQTQRTLSLPLWGSLLLFSLYAIGYTKSDAPILLLPAALALALLIPLGLQATPRLRPLTAALPAGLLLLNLITPPSRTHQPVRPLLETTAATLPPDALVITAGNDETLPTLWFLQAVEQRRTDLRAVDDVLFGYDWYRQHLLRHYPDLKGSGESSLLPFIEANRASRPLCYLDLNANTLDCNP